MSQDDTAGQQQQASNSTPEVGDFDGLLSLFSSFAAGAAFEAVGLAVPT